eukprot:COSAG06_NODE_40056_length_406_cov_0.615635_1_plen_68_part_00
MWLTVFSPVFSPVFCASGGDGNPHGRAADGEQRGTDSFILASVIVYSGFCDSFILAQLLIVLFCLSC